MGIERPVEVITDYRALEFFRGKYLLNVQQIGYAELLAKYNLTITYRPGTKNAAANVFIHKLEDYCGVKERRDIDQILQIFTPASLALVED